jgi:hypothetical protein
MGNNFLGRQRLCGECHFCGGVVLLLWLLTSADNRREGGGGELTVVFGAVVVDIQGRAGEVWQILSAGGKHFSLRPSKF